MTTDWKEFATSLFGKSAPTIRAMEAGDLEEVLRIVRLHDSDDYRAAKRAFSDSRFDLPEDESQHFVLIDPTEKRIVGVSGYFVENSESRGIYWLGWTYLSPFFRRKGYGAMLLHFVIRSVKRFGARKIYLSTSDNEAYAPAVAFYKRFGFEEEGRLKDYFQEGEAKIILGLDV